MRSFGGSCGGLMQLVAYGAQDQYLTADPSITFFKTVYRNNMNQINSFMDMDQELELNVNDETEYQCPESFTYDTESDDEMSDEEVMNDDNIVIIVLI